MTAACNWEVGESLHHAESFQLAQSISAWDNALPGVTGCCSLGHCAESLMAQTVSPVISTLCAGVC